MLRFGPHDPLLLVLVLAVLALVGCSKDEDQLVPNDPPETSMVSPPNPEIPSSYRISLSWLGTDPDGFVESYQWRISNDGPDGVVDVEDTLGLPWQRTVRSDSLFEASAEIDSFPPDVENPLITDPIDFRWWQHHTFWVRAVDQQGGVDPTPTSASFLATTTPPKIEIDIPGEIPRKRAGSKAAPCFLTNPVVALGVETIDTDDPLGVAPEYRYALLAVEDLDPMAYASLGIPALQPGDCLGPDDFLRLELLPWVPDSSWTAWTAYVDTEEPTLDFTLPTLDPGTSWFLFLQARDRAGALTPTLRYDLNFFEFKVEGGFSPLLEVTDPEELPHEFTGDASPTVALELQGDGSFGFTWSADASGYAGAVTGYRYALDPVDPLEVQEAEWDTPWASVRSAALELDEGDHALVVAAQDNSGAISYGRFVLSVMITGN